MVAGLSMEARSSEHVPLPQSEEEAGASLEVDGEAHLQSAEGVPGTDATNGGSEDQEHLLRPGPTPAGDTPPESLATHGGPDKPASSDAELSCSTMCALLDSGGEEKIDEAERAKVRRKLSWAIVLCCLFMGIEVCGGLVSNSLAILTDAAHLLSDVAGFAISLFALWAVSWRATQRHSYGYQRMEILGALASILMTWVITAVIVFEAVNRLLYSDEVVNGRVMFVTAAFGVVVNVAMAVLLFEHHSHGLPGQACSGHDHSHAHDHSVEVLPSPKKAQGYGRLEQAEEGPAEKDSFVEAGRVELSKMSAPAHVAVVVHQADDNPAEDCTHAHVDEHAHEQQHQDAHSHAHSHDHAHSRAHEHSHGHGHAHKHGHGHAHKHGHGHAHKQSHEHHGHAHGCSHGEDPRRASPSHTTVPAAPHEEKEDSLTALFGPLQLLSDGHEGHEHGDGKCGGGHAHSPKKQNINLRGAFVHVLGDLVQSVGVMVAGAIIWVKPQWRAVDLGCTFLFSALVVATTVKILRDIVEILMECTPRELDAADVEAGLLAVEGVAAVHELHIWAVSVGKNVLACHVEAKQGADTRRVLREASFLCNEKYRIKHVTIQVEQ